MLLSIDWLKDYLQKPDIPINPNDLADQLTMRGLPAIPMRRSSIGLDNVVVGRIEKIEPHPDADRLQITHVIATSDKDAEPRQIVCGATNIAEGDIVPVALPGAVLPGDFEIKESKIRGVESKGMLCSGKELQLSDDADGILKLPKHSQIGESVGHLLGHDDTILEFELTPNRSDCLSVIGLAREIAPLIRTRLREPKPPRFRNSPHRTSSIVKVEIDDAELCPRYVARVVDNLKVTASPDWIKQRLQRVGIRPVNNIVDITNFVLLEYGQPLHAFDLRKIESGALTVTAAKEQQEFVTLNDDKIQIEPGDILIQDGDRPVALAGIMGGKNSQIVEDTTSILLESAAFNPVQIRKTAKRLGLHTDSSTRFEKGVDLQGVPAASERAASLLREIFDANVYHPPIDTNSDPVTERSRSIDMRDVRNVTGFKNLSSEKAAEVLETIGIASHKRSANILTVKLPSFRLDLEKGIDVVEEIARLIGYENIPQTFPLSSSCYEPMDESDFQFEKKARNFMAGMGLREAIHYSFVSERLLDKYGLPLEGAIHLQNPISEEMKVMRTSLLGSLIQTYAYNKNRKVSDQKLFEIARTYHQDDSQETKAREVPRVATLLAGNRMTTDWQKKVGPVDFYYIKGLTDQLVRHMSTVYLAYEPLENHKLFHPKRSAMLKLGLREVGWIGEIHPFVQKELLETEEPIVLFELNLEALRKYERTSIRYKKPPRYPSSESDIALTVDKAINSNTIIDTIKQVGGTLLNDVRLFDVYQGTNIPLGKRSLAFRMSFLSPERTLQDAEVTELRDKIVSALEAKFEARLRD